MDQVLILPMQERAALNGVALERLYDELGERAAEDVVCRAMEEVAVKLAQIERLYRSGELEDMAKPLRALGAISEQIGMCVLARVAADVQTCARLYDHIALAAVMQRLMRAGESSLSEIWQAQNLSI